MSVEKNDLRRKLDRLFVPLTVGPTLIWIAAIIVYPTVKLLLSSLQFRNPVTSEMEFVGLRTSGGSCSPGREAMPC